MDERKKLIERIRERASPRPRPTDPLAPYRDRRHHQQRFNPSPKDRRRMEEAEGELIELFDDE